MGSVFNIFFLQSIRQSWNKIFLVRFLEHLAKTSFFHLTKTVFLFPLLNTLPMFHIQMLEYSRVWTSAFFFFFCSFSLNYFIWSHGFKYHLYDNDRQIFISSPHLSPELQTPNSLCPPEISP